MDALDLDIPVFSYRDFIRAYNTNGLLNAVKSTIRAELFDRGQWSSFHSEMKALLPDYDPQKTRLYQADAADLSFWKNHRGPFDLIFSTDVIEHIPPGDLELVLNNAKSAMSHSGLMILKPCIFSGVIGGHQPEWYADNVASNSSDSAWEHLWDPNFQIDTYLNRLTRRDYLRAFDKAGLQIVHEQVERPALGHEHLTPAIHAKIPP